MKYLKILVLCLLLVPYNVNASEKQYVTKNLEETLREEAEISKEAVENNVEGATLFEYDITGYQESDDQITIYLFRGSNCAYCKRFLTFLTSIVPEYGKYFKLESYEVWYNKDNSELLEEVSEFLDESAGGVPFIVIGDQAFPGYASQYDESIKKAIVDLYNSENRYDVFEEMERTEKLEKIMAILPYAISAGISLISAGAIIVFMHFNNKKLNDKLSNIEAKLNEIENKKLHQNEKEDVKKIDKQNKKNTKNKKKTDEK